MIESLRRRKTCHPFPRRISAIPKINRIAKLLKLRSHRRRIGLAQTARNVVDVLPDLGEPRHQSRNGNRGKVPIWHKATGIVSVWLSDQPSDAVCCVKGSILVEHGPLGVGLAEDDKNMTRTRDVRPARRTRQIGSERVLRECLMPCCHAGEFPQSSFLHARHSPPMHGFAHGIHAIKRLPVIENTLIKEWISCHPRVFPVYAVRIGEASPKTDKKEKCTKKNKQSK